MEEIKNLDDYKQGFNLGYRLGQTPEGRRKAVELGKMDTAKNIVYKGVEAGVKQAMADDLKASMRNMPKFKP